MTEQIKQYMQMIGKRGGQAKTDRKRATSLANLIKANEARAKAQNPVKAKETANNDNLHP